MSAGTELAVPAPRSGDPICNRLGYAASCNLDARCKRGVSNNGPGATPARDLGLHRDVGEPLSLLRERRIGKQPHETMAGTPLTLLLSTLARARSGSTFLALKELRQFFVFPSTGNAVRGRFGSFEEARRSAPPGAQVGYDTQQHANLYDERIGKVLISDYPVLYWLGRLVSEIRVVFDMGGHKGELFYGFREKLPMPDSLRWLVHDLPSSTSAGVALAKREGAAALDFTTALEDGSGCDLLIASGVLQYLEQPLAAVLASWEQAPRYLIVNNTPMYEGSEYVTLQNMGVSYNPYRVFNRAALIGSLAERGYVLRDHWRTERSMAVPLKPDLFVEAYQGFFMEKARP